NYFYADLPKGYQITQDTTPICNGGSITLFPKANATTACGSARSPTASASLWRRKPPCETKPPATARCAR
ncbi:MAG: hypothetical protein JKY38_10785, partial [Ralstonia sp.]|nr:hypothetical protein [Ralstonia sp.]